MEDYTGECDWAYDVYPAVVSGKGVGFLQNDDYIFLCECVCGGCGAEYSAGRAEEYPQKRIQPETYPFSGI